MSKRCVQCNFSAKRIRQEKKAIGCWFESGRCVGALTRCRWQLCTIRRCYWELCYNKCWSKRNLFMIPASHHCWVNTTTFTSFNNLSQSTTARLVSVSYYFARATHLRVWLKSHMRDSKLRLRDEKNMYKYFISSSNRLLDIVTVIILPQILLEGNMLHYSVTASGNILL